MEKKKKTINEIKIGDKFCDTCYVEDYQDSFEVVGIEVNGDGGKPCYNEWGRVVWNKPMYDVVAKSLKDGKIKRFSLLSETDDMGEWKYFYETEEERRRAIFEYRKNYLLRILNDGISEFERAMIGNPLYEDVIDEDMNKVLDLVVRLKQILLKNNNF